MTFVELYGARLDEELGNSDSTQLFTDARRKFAINEGMRQFADLTECYTRHSSIASSHGIGEYNLLSTVHVPGGDFARLSKQQPEYQFTDTAGIVTYRAGDDFRRTTVEELNEREPGWRGSTGGTPQVYYERMDGGRRLLGLYPPPQIAAGQTGTVLVPYVAIPPTMTSDTEVPFTQSSGVTRTDLEPFHMACVHYAAYQLEKLRVQPAEGAQQLQLFIAYVQRFVGELRPKGGTVVKPARGYFRESRRGGGGLRAWRTDLYGDRP